MISTAITSPVLIVKPDGFRCCIACLGDVLEVVLGLDEEPCGVIGAVFHAGELAEEVVFSEKACGVEVGVYTFGVCGFCDEVVTTWSAAPTRPCCAELLPMEGVLSGVCILPTLFEPTVRDIPQFGQNGAFAISDALH